MHGPGRRAAPLSNITGQRQPILPPVYNLPWEQLSAEKRRGYSLLLNTWDSTAPMCLLQNKWPQQGQVEQHRFLPQLAFPGSKCLFAACCPITNLLEHRIFYQVQQRGSNGSEVWDESPIIPYESQEPVNLLLVDEVGQSASPPLNVYPS